MYRNVSDKKNMELYMYNSEKWSYTCITRKKMELHMYNSKKKELYIPIHFIVLVGFGAKVFERPYFFLLLFDQKMRPHGPRLLKSNSSHKLKSGIQNLAGAAQWAAVIQIEGDARPTNHTFLGTPSRLKSVHKSHFFWCCQIMAWFYYNRSGSLSRFYTN